MKAILHRQMKRFFEPHKSIVTAELLKAQVCDAMEAQKRNTAGLVKIIPV